ncbi:hypothetical protein GDO86_017450 [Hymenochirus boettgeri]|uniref:Uncharacterized protein n=1 Tax=Hymenochirus boettgeri TaxID=247094 RepID=A0A8T2IQ41_9PIPI|nr:hypothetical protein GDO86_017450 [Hymenochirus boettgeri]
MEEAPKGTFEDELEWCIKQLETGLLQLNPSARQASDTEQILKVLRSRKAPFVRKRQVMNQVFGNYRLKMAEERQAQERAAHNLTQTHKQECAPRDLGSVAYRKCSKDMESHTGHWFTSSDNSFRFSFNPEEPDKGEYCETRDIGKGQPEPVKTEDIKDYGQSCILSSGSQFAIDFQVPKDAATSLQSHNNMFTQEGYSASQNIKQTSKQSSPEDKPEVLKKTQNLEMQSNIGNAAVNKVVNSGDPPKKKKKKGSRGDKPTGANNTDGKDETLASKAGKSFSTAEHQPQGGDDDLRKELDWCVEQLEIGLQRRKSTPKQAEEAMRAIKTLRSEKAPLVKKRQVMRAMFGDYRKKMEEENQKQLRLMQAAAKSARVKEVAAGIRQSHSKVFRQSLNNLYRSQEQAKTSQASSLRSSTDDSNGAASNKERFIFQSSQETFCFNFF